MSSHRSAVILKILKCFFPILCTFSLASSAYYYNVVLQNPTRFSLGRMRGPPKLNFTNHSSPFNLSLYFQTCFSYPPGINLPPHEKISQCNCERPLIYYYQGQSQDSSPNRTTIINSTCSDPGTLLSPLQKVISYSLYLFPDANRKSSLQFYLEGLQVNIDALRKFYPGYTLRLYTNLPKHTFCQFYCLNPDLFWCNVKATPLYGDQSNMHFMTWRFLPLGDPSVDIFLSRDLDSVLTQRESAVIQDWLQLPEKKAIHLMRDKFEAHNAAILGGMWGAKNGYFEEVNGTRMDKHLGDRIREESELIKFQNQRDEGFDQNMLGRVVFEGMKKQIVAYDSYHCEEWGMETMIRPFPVRRRDSRSDFVGNVAFGREKYQLEKCPMTCRPQWGMDWEYC